MRSKLFIRLIFAVFLFSAFSIKDVYADSVTDNLNNYAYPTTKYKKAVQEPFSIKGSQQTEEIDALTGNLEIAQTDISLKGKGGLDFNLTRLYSLSDANFKEPIVEVDTNYTLIVQGYYVNGTETKVTYKNGLQVGEPQYRLVSFGNSANGNGGFTELPPYFPVSGSYSLWTTSQFAQTIADSYNNGVYNTVNTTVSGSDTIMVVTKYNDKNDFKVCIQHDINRLMWQRFKNNKADMTAIDKYFNLGTGWSFDIPFIEKRGSNDNYFHYGNKGTIHFLFDRSWGEVVFNNSGAESKQLETEGYVLQDISFFRVKSTPQNYQAYFMVTDKNGKSMYFNENGGILCIRDRYGNEIKFENSIFYAGNQLITKITDSVGRIITFNYEANRTIVKVDDEINPENNKTIYYNKLVTSNNGNVETVLDSVVDAENRITKYEYDLNNAAFSFAKKDPFNDPNNPVIIDQYACLKRITYPTGAKTEYAFSNPNYTNKNLGTEGFMQFYKVTSRADYKEDNTKYNFKEYKYENYFKGDTSKLEYDGYPVYTQYTLPTNFTVKTNIFDSNNNNDTYIYGNTQSYINGKYYYGYVCKNIILEGVDHKKETIYTYDEMDQLTSKVSKDYNKATNVTLQSIENYIFDEKANLKRYWNPQAEGDTINTEHSVQYMYDVIYNYVQAKIYKKDANTTIKEEYIPYLSDHKNVEWYRVSENGVLKKQIQYLYDAYGNVIEERNYKDNMSDYISTKYSYDDNNPARNGKFNGLYLTRKWADGVKDADGNLIVPKSGNNPGTIDEIYKYDWFGRVVQLQDGVGNTTAYEYDKMGRMKKETHPDGTYNTKAYNDADNIVIVTDENGKQVKFDFDGLGNLESQIDLTTGEYLAQYTYDNKSRVKTVSNNSKEINCGTQIYYYTSDGKVKKTEIKDKSGALVKVEEYAFESAINSGAQNKITDIIVGETNAPSIVSNTYINKFGQVDMLGRIHNGIEYTDTFKYNYLGQKIEEKNARANDEKWAQPFTAKYEYDFAGRNIKTYSITGDFVTAQYDALGRVVSKTDAKGNKANPVYSTTYVYDDLGRVVQEKIPFENTNGSIYYSVKKYYYDRNGNVLITKVSKNKPGEAEAWNKIEYEYNNRNMLIKVTTYANEATPENYTQYYYDAVGNKIRMYTGLNGNLTITTLDNVMPTTDDKYSTTKYSYNQFGQLVKKIDPLGKEETYEYDLNGLLKQYKDRNESIVSYNRDALNRMLNRSVTTTNGSGNETYSYSYYLTGARKSMSGGGVNTNYIYDDLGRVIVEIESNGTTKEYTYDAANNRKSFIVKQNGSIIMNTTYEYDNMNRLYKTYENGQLVATYTYDINGNRDILTYGNGVSTKYDYNLANKMKTLTNKNSAGVALSKFDYTYYLDGNQASKSDSEGTTSYKYDGLSRISSVEGPNGLYKNYGYDDNNNRLYLSGNDEIFINDTDISYKYDGFNQLKSAVNQTTTTYSYNGDGIRISKNVGGVVTTHILDGGNVAADVSGTITKYVRGINLICSEISGQRYYYLYNGHGDVIQIIDNNGSVVNNYKYDEWGNIITQTEGINNPFKYCGEYFDKETGFIYLRARYYDPTIGRFITEDSFAGYEDDPLSLNYYTYCYNNPVNIWDPTGFKGEGEVIKCGSSSELDVRIIQMRLNDLGYVGEDGKPLIVDGNFQQNTYYAVTKFQENKKLQVDGEVGDETWESMGLILNTDITDRLYDECISAIYKNVIYQLPKGSQLPEEANAFIYYQFYEMVRNKGPMDLKQKKEWRSAYFIFDGKIVSADAPGNIAYGIMGKILHIDEDTLLMAAGAAQIKAGTSKPEWRNLFVFGDDPMDQLNIHNGFYYYDKKVGNH